jgi:hypothetical protein
VVRRRRATLDQVWATVLSDLPPALHPLVIRYVENMREGQEIRSELSTALTQNHLRWTDVDKIGRMLAFG